MNVQKAKEILKEKVQRITESRLVILTFLMQSQKAYAFVRKFLFYLNCIRNPIREPALSKLCMNFIAVYNFSKRGRIVPSCIS